ncbi:origin recognition complex subunit 3 [Anopheles funestus]|uniref:Origin recognition complex subunit 3 n=1 Tax=Anopheles funestus TaxID=62324 RepID=A0A182RRD7_ANOFN|nr:origin recognition complex subunit 3 [Anopheles funestus]
MDATNSVSKGVFVFKNGATRAKGRRKVQTCNSFLAENTTKQLWFRMYKKHWERSRQMILKLQTSSYGKIIDDLLKFIESCQKSNKYEGFIPTAALLTGINQIDHLSQFEKLAADIHNNTLSVVVLLPARDGTNLKQAIETIVGKCIESQSKDRSDEKRFRKNQLNLDVLQAWYLETHGTFCDARPKLTIIVPDFELFNPVVLQDLIVILDSYAAKLPFVLVFGVATDVSTIHNVLPYHVTSKIKISVFQSEPSATNLNKILNEVLLTPFCPFHLSGKVFKLLLDIFLFYDFSVNGFIEGFKYAFMDHYFQNSINALSAIVDDEDELKAIINDLSSSELEQIRQLPSFRPYVESRPNPQDVVDLLTNDDHLKRSLVPMVMQVHNYWFTFHCSMHILQTLVGDLPKAPLGKQIRELYCLCVASDVTSLPEFKECIQLLSFLSKDEMLQKIKQVLNVVLLWVERNDQLSIEGCLVYDVAPLEEIANGLVLLADELVDANHEPIAEGKQHEQSSSLLSPHMGRQELREKLLSAAKHSKSETTVSRAIGKIMDYFVRNIFQRYLRPATSQTVPLVELFIYNDSTYLRQHIVGAPRAAVHIALNNPQYYTQCDCCILDESSCIVPSLPDLSIAYKLHLECGRMINLFDWLQAFRMIIDDNNNDEIEQQVDPTIQARFTRVVAELQFLGFIKTSKTKTDHVTRLTW